MRWRCCAAAEAGGLRPAGPATSVRSAAARGRRDGRAGRRGMARQMARGAARERLAAEGVVMLGCGKMGSALLAGWLRDGLPPACVRAIEPVPSDWLRGTGVALDGTVPE